MSDVASRIDQIRADARLIGSYLSGMTPDGNTQTQAEVAATEAAVEAAIERLKRLGQ